MSVLLLSAAGSDSTYMQIMKAFTFALHYSYCPGPLEKSGGKKAMCFTFPLATTAICLEKSRTG